ncbi:MAG: hypothetical protein OXF74_07675 [Rhodobacteraceae bacterium]|nr:hypothetical protein [Paracoccaceae bacterium]
MTTWSFALVLQSLGGIPSADELFTAISAAGRLVYRKVFDRIGSGTIDDFAESYDLKPSPAPDHFQDMDDSPSPGFQ